MDPGESRLLQFLAAHGLRCERPSKLERKIQKTPDYRVFEGEQFRFFCELKGVLGDDWLGKQLVDAPVGTIVGGSRPDPAFNRLTEDIHQGVKQFDAVNPSRAVPNVLAFVNYEEICDVGDLLAVLTGNFYADDGSRHPIYRQYSEGRIREEKKRVDLYLWLDANGEDRFVFTETSPQHHVLLCRCFGTAPEEIVKR
jgi:hypothetical protein